MVKYKSDEVFAALSNPVRRDMVAHMLGNGRMSLSELAHPFSMSLPAAMKHVAALEESGIVVSTKEGRVRYCAVNTEALAEGMAWFRAMEQMWEHRLDRLNDHLMRKKN